jgi:alpha-N-arabinofuranosidase
MPHDTSRRRFLASLGEAGVCLAAGSWLDVIGYAQAGPGSARAVIEPSRASGAFDRRLLGSFLEHLGRAIYTGVYQPGSALADARGFRTDVVREIKTLDVPIVRYPGGNFVSGYNWLDGVGPKAQRPTVLDRAWNSLETNQFGTNDFIDWCRLVGTEPLLGMNFGTGTAETAVAYVEYCNLERGTKWSDLRRSHGYEQPHNVRYWCLGNEMDGPWQIGQMQAREYGRKARDVAKQVRVIDNGVQLIACGSSSTGMPTYLVWDREVLEECYDQVDGISLHAYYGNTRALTGNSTARYLAMNLDMDRQIREIAAVCDYVQAMRRSSKRLWLSFDEWNVWYRARSGPATDGRRAAAPNLLEEVYDLEDALLVGGFVNTLLRNSGRVRVGCLAQLVNVIAPLVTSDAGVLRQSIYYPYAWALQYARGQVLDLRVESQTYPIASGGLQADFARDEQVPYVDVVATQDPQNRQACVLMLNRDLDGERELQLEWRDATPTRVLTCETLTGPDLQAFNTFEQPRRVRPERLDAPAPGARMTFRLPARSYTVAHLAITAQA